MLARETETYTLVAGLLDHYVDSAAPPRFYGGSTIPALETAQQKTQQALEERFGMEVPIAFSHQDYTRSSDEEKEVNNFTREFFDRTDSDYLLKNFSLDPLTCSNKRDRLATIAAQIRRDTYKEVMDIERIKPAMTISEPLCPVGSLLTTLDRKRLFENGTFGTSNECVITVYGMNATHLIQDETLPGEQFDSVSAASAIERKAPKGKKFDLPWLLGSLGTEYAQDRTGHMVRVRGTLGLDFGEIEERVIKPLRSRAPGWKFILNTLLASESFSVANHSVTVIQASDEVVTVQDPKRGTVEMSTKDFWDRWASTDMQAAITIAKPVAA